MGPVKLLIHFLPAVTKTLALRTAPFATVLPDGKEGALTVTLLHLPVAMLATALAELIEIVFPAPDMFIKILMDRRWITVLQESEIAFLVTDRVLVSRGQEPDLRTVLLLLVASLVTDLNARQVT